MPRGDRDGGRPAHVHSQVGLAVLNPEGIFLNRGVPHLATGVHDDEPDTGGTWHELSICAR